MRHIFLTWSCEIELGSNVNAWHYCQWCEALWTHWRNFWSQNTDHLLALPRWSPLTLSQPLSRIMHRWTFHGELFSIWTFTGLDWSCPSSTDGGRLRFPEGQGRRLVGLSGTSVIHGRYLLKNCSTLKIQSWVNFRIHLSTSPSPIFHQSGTDLLCDL